MKSYSLLEKELCWPPAGKASLSRRIHLSQSGSDKTQTKGAVKHSQGLEETGLVCSEGWLARERDPGTAAEWGRRLLKDMPIKQESGDEQYLFPHKFLLDRTHSQGCMKCSSIIRYIYLYFKLQATERQVCCICVGVGRCLQRKASLKHNPTNKIP